MGSARTSRAPRARAPRTPPSPFYGLDNYIHYTFTNNLHANHHLVRVSHGSIRFQNDEC